MHCDRRSTTFAPWAAPEWAASLTAATCGPCHAGGTGGPIGFGDRRARNRAAVLVRHRRGRRVTDGRHVRRRDRVPPHRTGRSFRRDRDAHRAAQRGSVFRCRSAHNLSRFYDVLQSPADSPEQPARELPPVVIGITGTTGQTPGAPLPLPTREESTRRLLTHELGHGLAEAAHSIEPGLFDDYKREVGWVATQPSQLFDIGQPMVQTAIASGS